MAKKKRGYVPTPEEAKKQYGGAGAITPKKKPKPSPRKSKPKAGSMADVGYEKGGIFYRSGPALRQIRTGSPKSKKAPRKRRSR